MVSKSFCAARRSLTSASGSRAYWSRLLLGDLCRIFSLGEIDDGPAGPASHGAFSRGEDSVGRLTAGCGQDKGEDQH